MKGRIGQRAKLLLCLRLGRRRALAHPGRWRPYPPAQDIVPSCGCVGARDAGGHWHIWGGGFYKAACRAQRWSQSSLAPAVWGAGSSSMASGVAAVCWSGLWGSCSKRSGNHALPLTRRSSARPRATYASIRYKYLTIIPGSAYEVADAQYRVQLVAHAFRHAPLHCCLNLSMRWTARWSRNRWQSVLSASPMWWTLAGVIAECSTCKCMTGCSRRTSAHIGC